MSQEIRILPDNLYELSTDELKKFLYHGELDEILKNDPLPSIDGFHENGPGYLPNNDSWYMDQQLKQRIIKYLNKF